VRLTGTAHISGGVSTPNIQAAHAEFVDDQRTNTTTFQCSAPTASQAIPGALNAIAPNDKAAMRFTNTVGFEGMPDVMTATCGGFEGIEHAHDDAIRHEYVRVMRIERNQPGNEKEMSR